MPSSTSVLAEIIAHKRREVDNNKSVLSVEELEKVIQPGSGDFLRSLTGDGLRLITELKPSSPSAGVLQAQPDIAAIINAYDKHAAAISVLTDKRYFGGSLELLAEVVTKTRLPVLCKDFIIDELQIYQARKHGAEAILLIVKALDDMDLAQLHATTIELGMTPVVEIQNEEELKRALNVTEEVILINNRNLDTLSIDLSTTERLAPLVPAGICTISASGIENHADLKRLRSFCSRFLIGSALMKSDNIEQTLEDLIKS